MHKFNVALAVLALSAPLFTATRGEAVDVFRSASAAPAEISARSVNKCKACHTFDKGGKHKTGPNLYGIVGRKAGIAEGFRYSKSLQNAGFIWTVENLRAWLSGPNGAIKKLTGDPGAITKMPEQRLTSSNMDEVIAYLIKNTPAAKTVADAPELAPPKIAVPPKISTMPEASAPVATNGDQEAEVALKSMPPAAANGDHARRPKNGGRAPASEPAMAPFEEIDRILSSLPLANIAFNTPQQMNINETAVIQLLLDLQQSMEELQARIEAEGERQGARIKVSPNMQAVLQASVKDFHIAPISPERQAISASQPTQWQWEVTPLRIGHHRLHLALYAVIEREGRESPRAIKTFERFIDVEITWGQRASRFIKGNWQWLWAALVVPVAGWWWRRRRSLPAGLDTGG